MPQAIVLDLPTPPSVNRTRKVHWAGHAKLRAWHKHADGFLMITKRGWKPEPMQRFRLSVEVPEDGCDLDNLKAIADYLRRVEIIEDDSRTHMRELHVQVSADIAHGTVRVRVEPLSLGVSA